MLEKKAQGGNGGTQRDIVVESPDRSVEIKQTSSESVDVVMLSVPLATEQNDGRESALDKYVHDHSIANVAQLNRAANEDEALDQLISQDPQYYPVEGQFLGWTDTNGDIHLSRYHALAVDSLPIYAYWIGAVYDDVHDSWCILSGGDKAYPIGESANFTVAVTHDGGLSWSYYQDPAIERWKWIEAGNGFIAAISGNSSQEIYYSTDGGDTWTKRTIRDRYWNKVRYDKFNSRFVFFGATDICVTDDFVNFSYNTFDIPEEVSGLPINDIAFLSANNVAYLFYDGEYKLSCAYGNGGTNREVVTFPQPVNQMCAGDGFGVTVFYGEKDANNNYCYYRNLSSHAWNGDMKLDFSVNRGSSEGNGMYEWYSAILHAFPVKNLELYGDQEYDSQECIVFCTYYGIYRGYVNLKREIL